MAHERHERRGAEGVESGEGYPSPGGEGERLHNVYGGKNL